MDAGEPSNSSSWKLNVSPLTPAAVPTPPPLPVLTAVKPGVQSMIGMEVELLSNLQALQVIVERYAGS